MNKSGTKATFLKPLLLSFLILLGVPVLIVLFAVETGNAEGGRTGLPLLYGLFGGGTVISYVLFRQVTKRFRRRFRELIEGMGALLEGDRDMLRGRIADHNRDEFGELGAAFNELQDYLTRQYADLERELQLAYRLQSSLLPGGYREASGFAIAADCRQTRMVGGDLFDIVPLGESKVAVVIGDVAGKGMPAALLMSGTMALLRRELRAGGSAADVLTRTNRLMFGALQGKLFVTIGLAVFDREETAVQYAGAGHLPPYLLRGRAVEEGPVSSLPLGVLPGTTYRDHAIAFPPDSRLVLFTDGIVESDGPDGQMLGFERFERLLGELRESEGLTEQVSSLMQAAAPSGDNRRADDRTIVIVRRR